MRRFLSILSKVTLRSRPKFSEFVRHVTTMFSSFLRGVASLLWDTSDKNTPFQAAGNFYDYYDKVWRCMYVIPNHLQRLPWSAMNVSFTITRLDDHSFVLTIARATETDSDSCDSNSVGSMSDEDDPFSMKCAGIPISNVSDVTEGVSAS